MYPRRGEVWRVSFTHSTGGEIRKTRPAIIISNDAANAALNRVIIIPMSRQVAKVYPGEALVTLHNKQCKAMANPIMTASKERLQNKAGMLSRSDLLAVESAVLLQLGIRR
ncbi:MAG TPA: type II toxin-antitoxin system PemK/MazF family toxin [Terriglobia bacterium]|nr:type II toxin-antitoxin system PemK/MazF family toxin [Terriglobia bacterium]